MSKVTRHLMWKRLLGYIPASKDRTLRESAKYERYSEYVKKTTPTEQDWVDHTFELLQRDHR